MRSVSIDPGLSGALAYHNLDTNDIGVIDMPVIPYGDKKKIIDGAGLADWLDTQKPQVVVLEQVAARTGQGVSSMFTFGGTYFSCIAVCHALGHKIVLVSPQRWKRHFGLLGKSDKFVEELACQLFPATLIRGKRGGYKDGRADALFMGRWYAETVKDASRSGSTSRPDSKGPLVLPAQNRSTLVH